MAGYGTPPFGTILPGRRIQPTGSSALSPPLGTLLSGGDPSRQCFSPPGWRPPVTGAWRLDWLLSVYLPWIAVTRISFIYHYYTAVPFLVPFYRLLPQLTVPAAGNGTGRRQAAKSGRAHCDLAHPCGRSPFVLPVFPRPIRRWDHTGLSRIAGWFSTWYFC